MEGPVILPDSVQLSLGMPSSSAPSVIPRQAWRGLMNVTIKQLRAFAMVADLQSFSVAADRLSLTTGAVSLLVRDLERELGFTLFDRTTRRVALSKAGREYLPAAHQVLRQMQVANLRAQDVKNHISGLVRVAAPLVVAQALLPRAMAEYKQLRPKVQVRPVDCAVEHLVTAIEEDHADIAIGPDRPVADAVRRVDLYESPWVLWCAPSHPLVAVGRVTWSMLARECVAVAGRDHELRMGEVLQHLPSDQLFTPTYIVENVTTALGLCACGLAVTLTPMYVGVVARGMGLVPKRVHCPELARHMSLYMPRNRSLAPVAAAFAEFVGEHLSAPQAPRH